MKKLMLLLATVGLALLTSCGQKELTPEEKPEQTPGVSTEKPTSLAGYWMGVAEGGGTEYYELTFTETAVTCYFSTTDLIRSDWSFTGTYTCHPPKVTIKDSDGTTEYTGIIIEEDGKTPHILIRIRGEDFGAWKSSGTKPDDQIQSLENSTWKSLRFYNEANWFLDILTFRADGVVYTHRNRTNGTLTDESFAGTYTYNPPEVAVELPDLDSHIEQAVLRKTTGTVSGRTLKLNMLSGDIQYSLEFKKQ